MIKIYTWTDGEYLSHAWLKKGEQAKNHKYIRREWRNGHWFYYYDDAYGKTSLKERLEQARLGYRDGRWGGKTPKKARNEAYGYIKENENVARKFKDNDYIVETAQNSANANKYFIEKTSKSPEYIISNFAGRSVRSVDSLVIAGETKIESMFENRKLKKIMFEEFKEEYYKRDGK